MIGKARTKGGLTPGMELFAVGVASGLNQSDAYKKAYPRSLKWADKTVWARASELAADSKVSGRIQELIDKACAENEITVEKVLKQLWDVATADVNELMSYRRVCCRYCYGKDHKFQWADTDEFLKEGQGKSDEGGYDFNPTFSPHARCPKCFGEGIGEVFFADTRKLTGKAKLLFDGIKITAQGAEIKTRDRDAALVNVGRHLKMFTDKIDHNHKGEHPLLAMLRELSGNDGNFGSLQVVDNPPGDDDEDD